MKFIRKNNFIDLEAPVYMSEGQLNQFKNFMQSEFGDNVEFIDVIEPEPDWSEREGGANVHFSFDELLIMLTPGTMQDKVKKLQSIYPNRSKWTIELKMGVIVPKFNKFLKEKRINHVSEEVIKQFLEEEGLL